MTARDIIAGAVRQPGIVPELLPDYLIARLSAAGYRILPPGELDGETLERAAREAERLLVFADTTSHADKAIASALRALRESGG